MRRLIVTFLFFGCSMPALAQPDRQPGQGDRQQLVRDQRRSELREVLRPSRVVVSDTTTAQANVPTPPSHHLTPEGRAELREQLRREQGGTRRQQP
jgi:hypothetical protein